MKELSRPHFSCLALPSNTVGQGLPRQLLKGRTGAELLLTMDTPPWYYKWVYRMPGLHQMRKTTLEFCGIKPLKTLTFGPILALEVDPALCLAGTGPGHRRQLTLPRCSLTARLAVSPSPSPR